MNTPIIDFVKNYVAKDSVRAHMPGHKGQSLLGFEQLDITEFDGADCLYTANGIIKESRENASKLFGAHTFYSAEGSSLCIRAMLYLAIKNYKGKQRPMILAGRNAHNSFISALGLLDVDVKWIYPEDSDSYLSCSISAQKLDLAIKECPVKPVAVFLTTPDYLGNLLDVKALSLVCKANGVKLLIDNAHGAYLKFLQESLHPIDLGADMCCDSAHKTLPALTGSAYLHLAKDIDNEILCQVEHALSVFGSTSPSYLILQSLDGVNKYLSEGYSEKLACFISKLEKLKAVLVKHGYELCGNEPLKFTIRPKSYGYTGVELNERLKANVIFVEFYDPDYLVMMFTPSTSDQTLEKVEKTLCSLPKKSVISTPIPTPKQTQRILSVKQALLCNSERIPVENAVGRVLADLTVNCPPAVPIAVCGEKIDENAVECFKYYGVKECSVVKE